MIQVNNIMTPYTWLLLMMHFLMATFHRIFILVLQTNTVIHIS